MWFGVGIALFRCGAVKVFINSDIDYDGPALGTMLRLLHLHVEQLPTFTTGFQVARARELELVITADGPVTIVKG